jgi:hypothetical protein
MFSCTGYGVGEKEKVKYEFTGHVQRILGYLLSTRGERKTKG